MDDQTIKLLIEKESNKSGLRGSINAKCIECIYDPISGNGSWRQQTQSCSSPECPLYSVRPKSSGKKYI